ncbi:hypothetical protein AAVH_26862, partial [Aphelenchoides avenae]
WFAICVWTYFVFSDDDRRQLLADCSETVSLTSTYRWSMGQYYCLASDIVVSIADLALLVFNKRQQSRFLGNYTLRKSYQLKENQLTTRIIFPCSIVHTLAFAAYLAVNASAYLFVDVSQPYAGTILDSTELVMGAYIFVTLTFFYLIRRRVSLNGFALNSPQAVDDYFHSFRLSIAFKDESTKGKAQPVLKIFHVRVRFASP